MEKINIAEILKDCPSGMELDCTMFDDVTFVGVNPQREFPIEIKVDCHTKYLTKEGCYHRLDCIPGAKCVIFPKGKTTWEGFKRPFKDGDVAVSNKGHIHLLKTENSSYCAYRGDWEALPKFDKTRTTNVNVVRLATEEEKQKLFDAIKENGYKWNAEKKTLEKFPIFKVGDRIKNKKHYISGIITDIGDETYRVEYKNGGVAFPSIEFQDEWELVHNKFDISTLKPFKSEVLVRDNGYSLWQPSVLGLYDKENRFPYITIGNRYRQCIPYEGNEHLLGTTNDCDDFYKTWE